MQDYGQTKKQYRRHGYRHGKRDEFQRKHERRKQDTNRRDNAYRDISRKDFQTVTEIFVNEPRHRRHFSGYRLNPLGRYRRFTQAGRHPETVTPCQYLNRKQDNQHRHRTGKGWDASERRYADYRWQQDINPKPAPLKRLHQLADTYGRLVRANVVSERVEQLLQRSGFVSHTQRRGWRNAGIRQVRRTD